MTEPEAAADAALVVDVTGLLTLKFRDEAEPRASALTTPRRWRCWPSIGPNSADRSPSRRSSRASMSASRNSTLTARCAISPPTPRAPLSKTSSRTASQWSRPSHDQPKLTCQRWCPGTKTSRRQDQSAPLVRDRRRCKCGRSRDHCDRRRLPGWPERGRRGRRRHPAAGRRSCRASPGGRFAPA